MTTNALQSLYGGKAAAQALAGNVGGQAREQEVHTRRDFLERAVFPALGGPPDYDPCAATDPAAWFARVNVTLPPELQALEDMREGASKAEAKAINRVLRQAYSSPPAYGEGSAFVNPPFKTLRPWMEWCQERFVRRGHVTIGHWPVRTGNAWWFPACRGGEIVFLSARYSFEGYKNAHPEDCCLVAYGCTIPPLGALETGRWRP